MINCYFGLSNKQHVSNYIPFWYWCVCTLHVYRSYCVFTPFTVWFPQRHRVYFGTDFDEVWESLRVTKIVHNPAKTGYAVLIRSKTVLIFGRCLTVRQSSKPQYWANSMARVHPTINDQITRVQLRLLKQVLQCQYLPI